jgi:predicted alpha/beta-hydrolase family hydrolase
MARHLFSPRTLKALAPLASSLALIAAPAEAEGPPMAVVHHMLTIAAADGRQVAVTVYAPAAGCRKCTLVIFSHGALSTPQRYDVLLDAWAASGLVVAAPLHTDSEEYPDKGRYPDSLATRLGDWLAVDTAMHGEPVAGVTLSGKVVAAGHSYGALIAEIAGGARTLRKAGDPQGWRVPAAVVAISPPGTMPALVDTAGFAAIARPTLVVTGTADALPGFIDDWHRHLDSYHAIRPGLAYSAVFAGMDHYFNGAYCRPTAQGQRSAPQVAALNRLAVRFIADAVRGALPGPLRWARRSDDLMRTAAR